MQRNFWKNLRLSSRIHTLTSPLILVSPPARHAKWEGTWIIPQPPVQSSSVQSQFTIIGQLTCLTRYTKNNKSPRAHSLFAPSPKVVTVTVPKDWRPILRTSTHHFTIHINHLFTPSLPPEASSVFPSPLDRWGCEEKFTRGISQGQPQKTIVWQQPNPGQR